jgi:hypothetical protein
MKHNRVSQTSHSTLKRIEFAKTLSTWIKKYRARRKRILEFNGQVRG